MREYGKDAPSFWIDSAGVTRKVSQIKGRLKPSKILLHADLKDYVINRDNRVFDTAGKAEKMGLF